MSTNVQRKLIAIYGEAYPLHRLYACYIDWGISSEKLVPRELQAILDEKFNFQKQVPFAEMDGNIPKFVALWMNPKTRKLAELLYL